MLGQHRGEHRDKWPGEQPMVVDDDYCDGHRRTTLVPSRWPGSAARDPAALSAADTRRITLIDPNRA
ncbi:hypothetical protein GCM10018962_81010 [Dactylosporangium matsuzakiense]|uniref:Uncharacterized protein n=1 Tax=Dactylosporangium matsuzakiense TaxID=53360 RepID=A0A9W6KHP8_9ACTN|nr:hypothetical protein GCM10017581_031540 [Dactylosporangium matsuzakiense]